MSDDPYTSEGDEEHRDDEPNPFRFDDEGVEESWTSDPDDADGTGSGSGSGPGSADDAHPATATTGPGGEGGTDADAAGPDAGDDGPLGDLAARVRERRDGRAEDDHDEDSPFEEMSAGEVDSEVVWESLDESTGDAAEAVADPAAALDATLEDASEEVAPEVSGDVEPVPREDPDAARPDHVVPTRSFCEQCQYFSEPPEVACNHEGTDIVELVDLDHFRVRGCPVVEEHADVTD